MLGVCLILFMALTGQLIKIQCLNYSKYSLLASQQRQQNFSNQELRGAFYDRNGKLLRGPIIAHYLIIDNTKIIPAEIDSLHMVFPKSFYKAYSRNKKWPVWVYSKPLNAQQIDYLTSTPLIGLKMIRGFIGRDPQNMLAWHLLGSFNPNSGLSGLEHSFQSILKNKPDSGTFFSILDGRQIPIAGLGIRANHHFTQAGVILTIDSRFQKIVESVMDKEKITGSVVMVDVKSGEILAMASRPLIQLFTNHESINNENGNPFVNRSISAYQPGSLIKLVTLSAGLDSGVIKPEEEFFDPGFYEIADRKWFCTTSGGKGHGLINLREALAYSCNPVFIEIALRLRPTVLLNYAEKFGLGLPCNIGLREESWGSLPTDIGLSLGEQANLALGQELIKTTPLQIASLIQTIANDGIRKSPILIKEYIDPNGLLKKNKNPKPTKVLTKEAARRVQDMMSAVTDYGTGTEAQTSMGTSGKTGTAQVTTEGVLPDHAWFAGYVPRIRPRYAAVVFCEKGISGGKTAAPLFREIMEQVNKLRD